jgi:4-hydroxythreonine-4-phosphate dehydrogenase
MTAPISPVLALTMGEPAGIGGEITLKAWGRRAGLDPFFVIDDPDRLSELSRRIGAEVPVQAINAASEAADVFATALPVLPADRVAPLPVPVVAGRPDVATAVAVIAAIETAVRLVQAGEAAAIVTNPIQKQVLYQAVFPYPGHTEFLGALAGIDTPPVMMLAADTLRVVPVTIHMSLRNALDSLNTDAIVHAGRVTAAALTRDFGIPHPRLAVAGLNPHAGEGGAMGTEEADIIVPAIEALQGAAIDAFGPVAPDSLFTRQARSGYDAAICMYHDQALIPIKTIAFESAVNVTLGLPFVRTSPDHGTALDIAGTGKADESSLLAALKLAGVMARRRAVTAA